MGLFSRKKKPTEASPSPALSVATVVPGSPVTVFTPVATPVVKRTIRLRVAVDPLPEDDENELFYIEVEPSDNVAAIRQAISKRLGKMSVALFKASIPWQAQFQARTYTNRYKLPISLINHFPAWSLDDPQQLTPSLGPAGWGLNASIQNIASPRVSDWWPPSTLLHEDIISILVRPAPHLPIDSIPLTLIAHYAPPDPPRQVRPSSASPPPKIIRRDPAVVNVLPSHTVDELKAAVLESDGRKNALREKVKLWKVEMSEDELIVIEERGGLKGGRMPWPYPPTAPEPTFLEDSTLPISHYFPETHSNPRMVNLTVWLHHSAVQALKPELPTEGDFAPRFRYPMTFEPIEEFPRRTSEAHSLPPGSPLLAHSNFEPVAKVKARRGRPSTAPATSHTAEGGSAGGSRPLGSLGPSRLERNTSRRGPSPLSGQIQGLGIGMATEATVEHSSIKVIPPVSPSTPTLGFDGLSLTVEIIDTSPTTPFTEKIDWHPAESLKPSLSIKSKSLGAFGRRGRA